MGLRMSAIEPIKLSCAAVRDRVGFTDWFRPRIPSFANYYGVIAPFLDGYIRKQISVFILDPVKKLAEEQEKRIGG
jgi:hypothetical protein